METLHINLDYPSRRNIDELSVRLNSEAYISVQSHGFSWFVSPLSSSEHLSKIKKSKPTTFGLLADSVSQIEPFVKLSTPQYRILRHHRHHCYSYLMHPSFLFHKKFVPKNMRQLTIILVHFGLFHQIIEATNEVLLFSQNNESDLSSVCVYDDGNSQFNRLTLEDISGL